MNQPPMLPPEMPPRTPPRRLTASLVFGLIAALAFGVAALRAWQFDPTMGWALGGLAALSLAVGLKEV